MAIANFVPELWSAAVMQPFEENLVYAQPSVANTDYEGTLSAMGDTVHVGTVGRPTVRAYDKAVDLVTEDVNVTTSALAVDQGSYFNFRVNDVDSLQAAGPVKDPALSEAAIGLRDSVDTYAGGLIAAGVHADNQIGAVALGETGDPSAWDVLRELRRLLNAQSVPTQGRYVVVGGDFESLLLGDDKFVRVDASGTDQGLRNGIVGRALGFDVLVSNNTPGAEGTETIIAGVPAAYSMVTQINKVEAAREEKRFADMVKGLMIYGSKVFRPEGLASAEVTVTSGFGVGNGDGGDSGN